MSQFERARELFRQQLERVRKEVSKNPEIRKLADEQFFDAEAQDNSVPYPPHIYEMPVTNKPNWSHLEPVERAIFVLVKSRAFTYKEIVMVISKRGLNYEKIDYLYKKCLKSSPSH